MVVNLEKDEDGGNTEHDLDLNKSEREQQIVFCDASLNYPTWPARIIMKHPSHDNLLVEFLHTSNWMLVDSNSIKDYKKNKDVLATQGRLSIHRDKFELAMGKAEEISNYIDENINESGSYTTHNTGTKDKIEIEASKYVKEGDNVTENKIHIENAAKQKWRNLFDAKIAQTSQIAPKNIMDVENSTENEIHIQNAVKQKWRELFDAKRAQTLQSTHSNKKLPIERKNDIDQACRFHLRGRCRYGNECKFSHISHWFITNGKVTKNLGPLSVFVYDEDTIGIDKAKIGDETTRHETNARSKNSKQNKTQSQNHFLGVELHKRIGQLLQGVQVPAYLEKELVSVQKILNNY